MPDELVLTIKGTAALLKMSERTVYLMTKQGWLPGAVKWGLVDGLREKLLAWLDANSKGGDAPRD